MADTLVYDKLLTGGRSVSRREFVKGIGAIIGGGVLLALGNRSLTNARLSQVSALELVRSTFSRHVGDMFQVYYGSATGLALRLAHVRDLRVPARRPAPAGDQRERSFSLLFTGPIDMAIEQGTYRFEHQGIGVFSLFIVPMAPDRDARRYEAIFNRIRG